MAASDAIPVPRKNVAWRVYFAIRKNDGTLITTWAGQDSEVSLDGASFADCTNEATEIGTSGCGYLDLTSGEMNADAVTIKITVTNASALPLVLTVFPESAGDYRVADTQKVDTDTISNAAAAKIADITLRRTQANVEASGNGDALSLGCLYGLVQQAQESDGNTTPGTLTVYRTDGTTSLGTKTLNTNASAVPVDRIS
jgi:hypothetical protein